MNRTQATFQIGDILESKCGSCPIRKEYNRLHGGSFSKIDNHCNRECPVGKQLQELGKHLTRS